ncbi:MAG: acyltransferase family protein, partial [Bacteroidota bacterium]
MNATKPEVVNIFERMINTGHRLTYFDGLRGVAACMVFFSHLLCAFYPATNTGLTSQVHITGNAELFMRNTPFNVLFNGELAVCIFFVISGYVLSH